MRSRSALLGAGVLALLIMVASLLPTGAKYHLHTQGALHPWLHMLAFGALAALCSAAAPDRRLRTLLLFATVFLAWGTEFLESLRDGWPVERQDLLLDAFGIVIGIGIGAFAVVFRPAARLR